MGLEIECAGAWVARSGGDSNGEIVDSNRERRARRGGGLCRAKGVVKSRGVPNLGWRCDRSGRVEEHANPDRAN